MYLSMYKSETLINKKSKMSFYKLLGQTYITNTYYIAQITSDTFKKINKK